MFTNGSEVQDPILKPYSLYSILVLLHLCVGPLSYLLLSYSRNRT
jgi:hypothetical protein